MIYKLEVISAAAARKEYFHESLEEILEQRDRVKEQLGIELDEALAKHVEITGCNDSTCRVAMRLKHEYFVKFRISIARWEVIG